MWSVLGTVVSIVGEFILKYFNKKEPEDAIREQVEVENRLDAEISAHKRTKDIHEMQKDIREASVNSIDKVDHRIQG